MAVFLSDDDLNQHVQFHRERPCLLGHKPVKNSYTIAVNTTSRPQAEGRATEPCDRLPNKMAESKTTLSFHYN